MDPRWECEIIRLVEPETYAIVVVRQSHCFRRRAVDDRHRFEFAIRPLSEHSHAQDLQRNGN